METASNLTKTSIKDTSYAVLKSVTNKSVDIYKKSQQQAVKIGGYVKSSTISASQKISIASISNLLKHPTSVGIRNAVQKYIVVIAAFPGLRDLLMTSFLKLTGFTASGIKAGGLSALIQSKFYGGFIAKNSIFSYLQSIGATGIFDPTIISLLLLGGTLYYYFCIYNQSNGPTNTFKWSFKDCLEKSEVTVPQWVNYKNGKFDIKWSNLDTKHNQAWRSLI